MANRSFYPSFSYGFGRVYADFQFQTNGASPPLSATFDGADIIASIAYSAVGTLIITLKDNFNKVVSIMADLDDTVNDGAYASIGSVTNEGTSTPIVFTLFTRSAGGTKTDYSGRTVRITAAFRNSTLKK
jgi:hypothetical protein